MRPGVFDQRGIRWKRLLIPLGLSLVTLIGLSIVVDGGASYRNLCQVDPILLALAALKTPVLVLLWSTRWLIILRTTQHRVRFRQTTVAVMIRSFINALTPGVGTGGEPAGAYYLARRVPMRFAEAIASTAAERMVLGLVFVVIVLVTVSFCLPMLPPSSLLTRSILVGLVGFVGFVGLMLYLSLFRFQYARYLIKTIIVVVARLLPPLRPRLGSDRIEKGLDSFHREYMTFLRNPKAILATCLLTAIHWGLEILQPYLLFRALHVEVPFWLILMNMTVVRTIGIFSIIPGGAGLVEGMNFGLYAGLSSLSHQVILSETVLFRALDSWMLWIGSGIVTSIASASFSWDGFTRSTRTAPPS